MWRWWKRVFALVSVAVGLRLPTREQLLDRRVLVSSSLGPGLAALALSALEGRRRFASAVESAEGPKFRRQSPIQFIAALGDPSASSGTGADRWGLWADDPGPRGVRLWQFEDKLVKTGGSAPAGWRFDGDDWWLEEHGLIMPGPGPLPSKRYVDGAVVPMRRYVVTGDREVTSVLTVHADGRWELSKGTLFDVTHLPCRSARYQPATGAAPCTPASADRRDFPVTPGAAMPAVGGCAKQDYAVLFVVGVEATRKP
mmetsp:Transcript_5263/g.15974  ORF Transcript_5263/g.15974 Transcript_5263/m.15974 type:complete len:256 (-) Transcript_5263:16-783(-)